MQTSGAKGGDFLLLFFFLPLLLNTRRDYFGHRSFSLRFSPGLLWARLTLKSRAMRTFGHGSPTLFGRLLLSRYYLRLRLRSRCPYTADLPSRFSPILLLRFLVLIHPPIWQPLDPNLVLYVDLMSLIHEVFIPNPGT